ncbi:MAG: hypothetical protein F6K39_42160 [Okeania sp. SIO3B3]|nr:hypothetical protein [Okeania sp. SIO3B3]
MFKTYIPHSPLQNVVWINICSGNESAQKQFGGAMIEFKKQLQFDSLMVVDSDFYTLGKRELRPTLKKMKTGVKNQLGRLTDRQTLRWIFQCFQSVHLFYLQGFKQIFHLTNERLHLLKFFPNLVKIIISLFREHLGFLAL